VGRRGSFGQNLLSAGLNAAGLSEVTAQAAGSIGQASASGNLGAFGTELAHAAVGCVSGAARGAISGSGKGGCASGATGAVVAHVGAGWIDAATGYTLKDSEVGFYGGVLGGAASALVGNKDRVAQNFGSGQTTGQNAVDNNYLTTRDITAAKAQLAACTQGCEAIARVLGVDQSQGGVQTPVSRVQDLCKANPQGCAARVQDMAQAMQELQDPATRAALGPQIAQTGCCNGRPQTWARRWSRCSGAWSTRPAAGGLLKLQWQSGRRPWAAGSCSRWGEPWWPLAPPASVAPAVWQPRRSWPSAQSRRLAGCPPRG